MTPFMIFDMSIETTIVEKFIAWTKLKIRIHTAIGHNAVYFREREIWWCSLGANIGYEQSGNNDNFERPVLILKKFNKSLLWALPLTSQEKSGQYYYKISYTGRNYFIILSQIRTISSKRLLRKVRTLSLVDFLQVKNSIKAFL